MIFSAFINYLNTDIHFSECLLFADDFRIFNVTKSTIYYKLIRSNVDSVQKLCTENCMKNIQNQYFYFYS
jgi:hypothetical protein